MAAFWKPPGKLNSGKTILDYLCFHLPLKTIIEGEKWMAGGSKSYLFIINNAPCGDERPYNAMRLAYNLVKRERTYVSVFQTADVAFCARKGQKTPEGFYNEEIFVFRALDGLPSYPAYFKFLRRINQQGLAMLGGLPALKPLNPQEALGQTTQGAVIIDTRHPPVDPYRV
jgi:hypothetical protein